MSSRCSLSSFRASLSALNSAMAELPTDRKGSQAQNRKVQKAAQAVATNAKSVKMDSEQPGYAEMIKLAYSLRKRHVEVRNGGGFKRWFGKSLTEKLSLSAVQAINPILLEAAKRKLESTCSKMRIILLDNARDPRVPIQGVLKDLQKELPAIFSDPDFVFKFAQLCASNHPAFLCDNLTNMGLFEITLRNGEEIEQVGARLEEPSHREKFCAHFGCSMWEISHARLEYLENEKQLTHKLLGEEGNCFGYTLAHISKQNQSSSPEEISRLARFVQASCLVKHKMTDYSPEALKYIGNAVLNEPLFSEGPFAWKKQGILDDEGAKNPYLVGRFAVNFYKEIRDSREELSKEKMELGSRTLQKRREFETKTELLKTKLNSGSIDIAIILKLNDECEEIYLDYQSLNAVYTETESSLNVIDQLSEILTKAQKSFPLQEVYRWSAPKPILRNLGIKEMPALFSANKPIEELGKHLLTQTERTGRFLLKLIGASVDHAIELSFEPAYFYDPNDRDPHTFEPRKRSFSSASEMITHLRKQLAYTYGTQRFPTFNIIPYESATDADEVAEWLL